MNAGILAGVVSSALGGMAAAVTRFVIGATDPVTIAVFRFGLGFLFLLPNILLSGFMFLRDALPAPAQWLGSARIGFGHLFFAVALVALSVNRFSQAIE